MRADLTHRCYSVTSKTDMYQKKVLRNAHYMGLGFSMNREIISKPLWQCSDGVMMSCMRAAKFWVDLHGQWDLGWRMWRVQTESGIKSSSPKFVWFVHLAGVREKSGWICYVGGTGHNYPIVLKGDVKGNCFWKNCFWNATKSWQTRKSMN